MSNLLTVLILIFLFVVSSFTPIGNENSTVRRLPLITFSILALNVVIFFVTLPVVAGQREEFEKLAISMELFVKQHPELLADEGVRKKLTETGLMSKSKSDDIAAQLKGTPQLESQFQEWLAGLEAQTLRDELNQKITAVMDAANASLFHKWGFAPNGNWKLYQLITSAFLHGGYVHLFSNLIFFFAIAFSLEDLWGRGVFLGFYLLGAAASLIPSVIHPIAGATLGASGAISATMGAFLFRLPKTKIKLLSLLRVLARLFGKRPVVVMLPGYIFIIGYFAAQVAAWYLDKLQGSVSNVAFSAHFAGFAFGVCFAMMMKVTKYEEEHINPKIEAMVSFSAAPAVTDALEALDKGDAVLAERKLRAHLGKQPNDTNALMAAIQVYQHTSNFDRLNGMYARLIRQHLAGQDKEAALYAYDGLLSAFPDNNVAPRIPARDWIVICEYLRESEMNKEAAVEYERLVNACPDDPLLTRAAVQGGEVALLIQDVDRALGMFEKAEAANAAGAYAERARTGIEKCQRILDLRPNWTKQPQKPQFHGVIIEEQKIVS